MKPTFIALLIFACASLGAQVFVTIDLQFMRPGVMYNLPVGKCLGVYARTMGGVVTDPYGFRANNIKSAAGITLLHMHPKDEMRMRLLVGANYNYFFKVTESTHSDLKRTFRYSLDIGIVSTIDRFSSAMIIDPLNREFALGFSYKLKRKP